MRPAPDTVEDVATLTTQHDAELTEALRRGGLRVTSQRLVLHRHLRAQDTHATAEQIRAAVADRLPGVSVQTVYATLELFEQLGIVRRVAAPGGATLFDSRRAPHHHLACRVCGRVQDLDAPAVALDAVLDAARAAGHADPVASVTVTGTCADCADITRG
ncbi:transcriptional repressor [Paraconexibacter algicola]|uniref:Transcriptional repressor n=1 Tax=Paraconexibacter algicola TaxID=2133960 RepID=A0A2T4UJ34_9ACTN|nr:transcriptional repressor [Paraconexibacter algicola]